MYKFVQYTKINIYTYSIVNSLIISHILFILLLTHNLAVPTNNVIVLTDPQSWKMYNVILMNPLPLVSRI